MAWVRYEDDIIGYREILELQRSEFSSVLRLRHIQQLIEDLERVAENPLATPCIEPPPHLADDPEIAELALFSIRPFQNGQELILIFHMPLVADDRHDEFVGVKQTLT